MAWESRRNASTYYYRKEWRNGTCVSCYIGSGPLANLSAYVDARERSVRQLSRLDLAELRVSSRRVDQAIDNFRRQVRAAVASALGAAGYYQHHRGAWRLKRGESMANELTQQVPNRRGLGILAQSVEEEILRCAGVGKTQNTAKVILAEASGIRVRLGWAEAPEHEKLLIETISLCWLRLKVIEQLYSQNSSESNYQIPIVEHFERRLTLCHRRYSEAVTALARVRRLGISVQINVGRNQNIAQK